MESFFWNFSFGIFLFYALCKIKHKFLTTDIHHSSIALPHHQDSDRINLSSPANFGLNYLSLVGIVPKQSRSTLFRLYLLWKQENKANFLSFQDAVCQRSSL